MPAAPRIAAAVICALTVGAPPARADAGPEHLTAAQRTVLLQATTQFRDAARAVAAGYVPTTQCVPGMGLHYVHPARSADRDIDPTMPEILIYTPGTRHLAALEYFRADADGNLTTTGDRPTLMGHRFDGPMPGHPLPPSAPPMPPHYDLHVWLYEPNPAGELNPTNPNVHCP